MVAAEVCRKKYAKGQTNVLEKKKIAGRAQVFHQIIEAKNHIKTRTRKHTRKERRKISYKAQRMEQRLEQTNEPKSMEKHRNDVIEQR